MKTLELPEKIYLEMLKEAERQEPLEACGLLAGKDMRVRKFYHLTNIEQSAVHFTMDPAEQFQALKDARHHGWEIIAVWHSHPATPPRLSEEDQKLAFMPDISYVVLSLAKGSRAKIRSFRLQQNEFTEQQIKITSLGEAE